MLRRKSQKRDGAEERGVELKTKGEEEEVEEVVRDGNHPAPSECERELKDELFGILNETERMVLELASIFGNRTVLFSLIDVCIKRLVQKGTINSHFNINAKLARKLVESAFQRLEKLKIIHTYLKGGYRLFIFSDGVIYNFVYDNIDKERRREEHLMIADYLKKSTFVTASLDISRHLRSAKEYKQYIEILKEWSNMFQRRNEVYLAHSISEEAIRLADESLLSQEEYYADTMFQLYFNYDFSSVQMGHVDLSLFDNLKPLTRSTRQIAIFEAASSFFSWSRAKQQSEEAASLERAQKAADLISKERLIYPETVYVYRTLALIYRRSGKMEQAIKYYGLAINCARQIGNLGDMARATMGLAALERDEGYYVLARQRFMQSMDLLIWSGQFTQLLDASHGLALLDMAEGELEIAREILLGTLSQTSTLNTPLWQFTLVISTIIDVSTLLNSSQSFIFAQTKWNELSLIRDFGAFNGHRVFLGFLIWETVQCILAKRSENESNNNNSTTELVVDSTMHKDLSTVAASSAVQKYLKQITHENISSYIEDLTKTKKLYSKIVGKMLKLDTKITKYGTVVQPRILNASLNSIVILETILQNMSPTLNTLKRASTPSSRSLFYNANNNNFTSSSSLSPAIIENSPTLNRTLSKHNSLTPLLSPPNLISSLNSSGELSSSPSLTLLSRHSPSPSPSPPSLYSPFQEVHDS